MPATALADWLHAASDETLAALLHARRDLATPPPADTTVLATRAGTPGSVARAIEELDTFTLAVLEALLLADADADPTTSDAVADLLGAQPGDAVNRLRSRALAWGSDDAISIVPAVRDVLGPYPAGLGSRSAALANYDLDAIIDKAGEDEKALLNTLAAGPPIGTSRDAATDVPLEQATTPVQRLLARGLLIRRGDDTVELPREVAIMLRGGVFRANVLAEPTLSTKRQEQSTIDETAAGEALEFLRRAESLLELWSDNPPSVLKTGGLGVRDLRKIANEFEIDYARATLLVELIVGSGLVAESSSDVPEWVPTTLTDSWLASAPATRWITLASAWLELPRQPGLVGTRDSKHKSIVALSAEVQRPAAALARRRVLDTLAGLPFGCGVQRTEDVVAFLAWHAPRRGGKLRDDVVRWAMAEAATLGLIALGSLTTASRALLEDDRPTATTAMADALPKPVDHVLVQADLTIIAPGPLEPDLAAEITAVANVESAGHATVYRVTEASIRRALDTGRSSADLHELFSRRSRTPIPQALDYLIDDVARRHGRLRGGTAGSFLRCDDETLLAEVMRNRVTDDLGLRKIASTVLISPLPLAETLERLREAGFSPAAEGPDGRVVDLRSDARRIPGRTTRTRRVTPEPTTLDSERIEAIVGKIRTGDQAAERRRGETVRLPAGSGLDTSATLALLTKATKEQREVWIGFVDSQGTASQCVIRPARVGGGMLEGTDNQRYPLHRITSAALVED